MIEINLIPPELRKKKKNPFMKGLRVPLEVFVGAAAGFFVLLILAHIALIGLNVAKISARDVLSDQWTGMVPRKTEVDGVINTMRQLQTTNKEVLDAIQFNDLIWAKKLNQVSQLIPRGVWLSKVALSDHVFYLEGSAIARGSNEMISVHSFTSSLKSNQDFMAHYVELELDSIQKRAVDRTNIADFLITLKIEGFEEDEF